MCCARVCVCACAYAVPCPGCTTSSRGPRKRSKSTRWCILHRHPAPRRSAKLVPLGGRPTRHPPCDSDTWTGLGTSSFAVGVVRGTPQALVTLAMTTTTAATRTWPMATKASPVARRPRAPLARDRRRRCHLISVTPTALGGSPSLFILSRTPGVCLACAPSCPRTGALEVQRPRGMHTPRSYCRLTRAPGRERAGRTTHCSILGTTTLLELMKATRSDGDTPTRAQSLHDSFAASLQLDESARTAQARWLGLLRCRPTGESGFFAVAYVTRQ